MSQKVLTHQPEYMRDSVLYYHCSPYYEISKLDVENMAEKISEYGYSHTLIPKEGYGFYIDYINVRHFQFRLLKTKIILDKVLGKCDFLGRFYDDKLCQIANSVSPDEFKRSLLREPKRLRIGINEFLRSNVIIYDFILENGWVNDFKDTLLDILFYVSKDYKKNLYEPQKRLLQIYLEDSQNCLEMIKKYSYIDFKNTYKLLNMDESCEAITATKHLGWHEDMMKDENAADNAIKLAKHYLERCGANCIEESILNSILSYPKTDVKKLKAIVSAIYDIKENGGFITSATIQDLDTPLYKALNMKRSLCFTINGKMSFFSFKSRSLQEAESEAKTLLTIEKGNGKPGH